MLQSTKRKRDDEFTYLDTTQTHANILLNILEEIDSKVADDARRLVDVVAAMREDCDGWWHALLNASNASEKTSTQQLLLGAFADEVEMLEDVILPNYFAERSSYQNQMGAQQMDDDFGVSDDEEESANAPTPPPVASELPTFSTKPTHKIRNDFVLLLATTKRYFANENYGQFEYLEYQLSQQRDDRANSILAQSCDLRRDNNRNFYGARVSKTADIYTAFRGITLNSLLALLYSKRVSSSEVPSVAHKLDVALLVEELEAVTELEYRYTEEELRLQRILDIASSELRDARQRNASPLVLMFSVIVEAAQLAMAVWRMRVGGAECADGFGTQNLLDLERAAIAAAEPETEPETDVSQGL